MNNTELKLDHTGKIDVDYYVQQAKIARSEFLAQLGSSVKAKVKGFFRTEMSKLHHGHRRSHSH
ncbi:RSP_7527 family protein [Gallaecimonas mangrovi]|uniref:RSP_7527 family protein n=1 Tax=Gallaecimonas mangrovi TaxID=2291597 RepID=UPI000E203373|nr:hypothetical protein [Gallaecimonas mangrovi]